jgi:hypothetical protein
MERVNYAFKANNNKNNSINSRKTNYEVARSEEICKTCIYI